MAQFVFILEMHIVVGLGVSLCVKAARVGDFIIALEYWSSSLVD